jgi:hypothetical protein
MRSATRPCRWSIPLLLLALPVTAAVCQAGTDLNAYYRFPASLGVEYQNLTPLSGYPEGVPYAISDVGLSLRVPLPALPVLQPVLRAGAVLFDSQNQAAPLKWDHTDLYGLLGAGYSYRFAKYLELGAELMAGFSESLYYNLIPDAAPPLGNPNLMLEAGARVTLAPSYSLSVEIHPSVKYLASLGPVSGFNGAVFGIGFGGGYRFGQDPDAPQAAIRAVRFEKPEIPDAFAAMQSWYARHPIGSITLVNDGTAPVTDIEVSLWQRSYMDSPTRGPRIAELKPGQSARADLPALFNDAVFAVEGVTPVSAEVIVTYRVRGRAAEQRQSVDFDLYDKRAIVWDDDRKVAALITPDDGALKNYGGFIRQACKGETSEGLNGPAQLAMQVFGALGEIGCLYQANTVLPFTKVQGNPTVVDTVHLARETLKTGLGDCSDLTVLYDSILESLAVDTGFITVPGHIFAAVNTRVPARDWRLLHPDRRMALEVEGELWVPVEITLVGKTGFMDAWRKAVEEWSAYDSAPEKRAFHATHKAWETYRAVGLKETDLGLQYGRKEAVVDQFRRDRDSLSAEIAADRISGARAGGKAADWNQAGIALARLGRIEDAAQAFNAALAASPGSVPARINLGNIQFLRQRFAEALAAYQAAAVTLSKTEPRGELTAIALIGVSRALFQLGRSAEAADAFAKAAAIDPERAREYQYLQGAAPQGSRGAEE